MHPTSKAFAATATSSVTVLNIDAVITVVRDLSKPLGKRFSVDDDGAVQKKAAVNVAGASAVMHHVPDAAAMADLLREVGDDPRAAIIPDGFKGLKIGEPFLIMPEAEIERRLKVTGRENVVGVHEIQVDGVVRKVVGRLKENISSGSWKLLDRDNDEHTPAHFARLGFSQWLAEVDRILPGVASAEIVVCSSSSSRVLRDGAPVGGGNGHAWVRISDVGDARRTQLGMLVRAAELGLTWCKPRHDRKTGAVLGHSLATIIDTSVWTPGRLVFVGQPIVHAPLTLAAPRIEVIGGLFGDDPLDTMLATFDPADAPRITREAGVEMHVGSREGSLKIDVVDLTLGTVLETSNGAVTVGEAVAAGIRLRCQTPFRASESFAAIFHIAPGGRPFVHDVGTGATHWLPIGSDDFEIVGQSSGSVSSVEQSQRPCEYRAARSKNHQAR